MCPYDVKAGYLTIRKTRRAFWNWILPILTACLTISLLTGCLHTYHDLNFVPDPAEANGYWIRIDARLFHKSGESNLPVDGVITDSTISWWDLEWHGNVDDTLRTVAHLESDSVRIWTPDRKDTLYCNIRQDMTDGRWNEWKCGRITYQQLNSRDITLRMIVYMVFSDGRDPRRFEVVWSGKQKTTRIHSDY